MVLFWSVIDLYLSLDYEEIVIVWLIQIIDCGES